MKKLLVYNRKFLRDITGLMFVFGCSFVVIMGASILAGQLPNVDLSKYPKWVGYLFLYGGFLILLAYMIDILSPLFKIFKYSKRHKDSLANRVKRVELEFKK